MSRTHEMVFVNLPVADVRRSREFFTSLGYAFDEQLSNETCLGLRLGPTSWAMLLEREFFARFHAEEVAERGHHEVLVCVSAESREQVDDLVDRAVAAGGSPVRKDEGGDVMYGRSYADLDGHIWEVMWMDVAAFEAGGEIA